MDENGILFSTAYFGPIHYYSRFVKHSPVFIEQFEHFNKQTYRNRCEILGANGFVALVIPVAKGRGSKIVIKDLKISYEMNWQRSQWQTIISAYNSSPYFEFYKDEIQPFFENRWKFLIDLNLEIHAVICGFLELDNKIILTNDYEQVPETTLNFREIISPKNKNYPDKQFQPIEYTQVFSGKFGFTPNLSVLDLIFNEGPNSLAILEGSIIQ